MSNIRPNKARIFTFDLLRIILTILVINVHIRIITDIKENFLEPYTWYTVPLFIVLSFFFSGSKPLITRIKRLFTPLVFWSAAGFIIHPNLFNIKNVFLQILTGHVVDTPLYYLILLILFTIIYRLIKQLPVRIKTFVYFLLIIIPLILEYSNFNYSLFSPMIEVVKKSYGRFVELIKYMPIGLAFGFLRKKINKNSFFLIFSLIFLILFFAVSFVPVPPDFHFSGLITLAGSMVIFSLTLSLSDFKFGNQINRTINLLGKYSFGVYLSHYLLLETLLKIDPALKLFISQNEIPFLLFYATGCYLFCFLFDLLTLKKLSYLVQ